MTKQELLEMLEGQEILSIDFEGCVMVHNSQVIQMGEVIDANPTKLTLQSLWSELMVDEGIDYIMADLLEEC